MEHRTAIFPQPGDRPSASMSGTDGDIPVIDLSGPSGRFSLDFHNLDAALAYLPLLAEEATRLVEAIRVHRRQALLLAAVQQTPHDPEQVAAIRARYGDEATAEVQ